MVDLPYSRQAITISLPLLIFPNESPSQPSPAGFFVGASVSVSRLEPPNDIFKQRVADPHRRDAMLSLGSLMSLDDLPEDARRALRQAYAGRFDKAH